MSRRAKHVPSHADERWVISYADLVTLLFGFFILLYATANADVAKFDALSRSLAQAFNVPVNEGAGGGEILDGGSGIVPGGAVNDISSDLEAIRQVVRQESERAGVPGQIVVSHEEDRIVIRLADNLLFASASADVRAGARPLLDIVGAALDETVNEVRVEGHTDTVPLATDRYPSNWELSSARATAVLRYLTDEVDVAPSRLFAAGFGEHRPIADNLTPEGRALNRRADIVVLYPSARIEGGEASPATSPNGAAQ
ncbi:MAG: flagellar motor protein MotB [Dehalococcoidia bacterium]